jgi:2-oxoglutarate ferredoxin oxidoreductase subunit alpha
MSSRLIEGNEAVAWGAHYVGCGFFAGYPITPATSVFNSMLGLLPPTGGTVLQAEDEIAAIGYCIGASMAGRKAMTATSGPGISLYSENISFAIGSEIPLVIVDVQRLGPSTGSATKGADGDIQFLRWGNTAGQPVIVLAPVDVADCFRLTMEAFNLSERFRCPVFLASNKEVGQTRESVDLEAMDMPKVLDRKMSAEGEGFRPFAFEREEETPGFLPLGGQTLVRQTSSTHGEDGYITADPEEIDRMQRHREAKVSAHVESFAFSEESIDPAADLVILSYGVTARSARDALAWCRSEDKRVSLLVLKTLWPVPQALIREKTGGAKAVLVAEMNQGQYTPEVERTVPDKEVRFVGKMNGELVSPHEIKESVDVWFAQ